MNLVSRVLSDALSEASSRDPRYRARIETTGRVPGGSQISLVLHDLSPKGMLIEATSRLTTGDTVELDALHHDLPPAAVVWSSGPFHGCTFSQPISEDLVREVILSGQAQMAGAEAEERGIAESTGIAARILKIRQRQGLTTEEFASRLGVSRQAVWYWETGQRKPRAEQVDKIQEIFGQAIDRGPGGDDRMPGSAANGPHSACIAACKTAIANALGVDATRVRISVDF